MIAKPLEEWTEEDWVKLRAASYETSDKVLLALEDQGKGDIFSPQVAGYALIIAMGRLSGKHGFRDVAFDAIWKLWTDGAAKREFRIAYEIERNFATRKEN